MHPNWTVGNTSPALWWNARNHLGWSHLGRGLEGEGRGKRQKEGARLLLAPRNSCLPGSLYILPFRRVRESPCSAACISPLSHHDLVWVTSPVSPAFPSPLWIRVKSHSFLLSRASTLFILYFFLLPLVVEAYGAGGRQVRRSRGPMSSCLYQAPGTVLGSGDAVMGKLDIV